MHPFTRPERYERHAGRLGRRLYDLVAAEVLAAGLPAGARVLDVGTGPGRIPRLLAADRPGWRVEGLDVEPEMIRYARERDPAGRVTFTVGDVAALPYPDASFDLVVSSLSQHHWADVPAGVRDVRRVLRPGGAMWLYDVRFALRRARRTAEQVFDAVRRDSVPVLRPFIVRLSARA